MAKKKDQSLTDRIAALINRVGEKPAPGMDVIKSALVPCLSLAKSLEDGAAIREAEAKLEAAQAALEQSDAALKQANTQNAKIESELQAAHSEIEKFRAEQKKREEKEREIAPIQFKILQRLASESECNWLRIDEIARAVKIPVDEAEIYINGLKKLGLASFHPHEPGGGGWHRTTEGNTLVVAKRWAGEGEERKTYKHADLPKEQHDALRLIAVGQEEGAIFEHEGVFEHEIAKKLSVSLLRIQHDLSLLRDAEMATDGDEPDYGAGRAWVLLKKGKEYLAERDFL